MNLFLLYGGKGGEGHGGSVSNYANFDGSLLFYGYVGENGINRETGGGGGGGLRLSVNPSHQSNWGNAGGKGAVGTSYSGGAGGGFSTVSPTRNLIYDGGDASAYGGGGGLYSGSDMQVMVRNGYGNPTGGTGGLLVINVYNLNGNGEFSSLGNMGWLPGGGSGCGSVNIFYENENNFFGKFNVKIENIGDPPNGFREYSTASGTRITSGAGTYNIGSIKTGVYISD